MREIEFINFRNIKPAPTQPGWYYGRLPDCDVSIQPCRVVDNFMLGLVVLDMTESGWSKVIAHRVDAYEWFGEVEEVREG